MYILYEPPEKYGLIKPHIFPATPEVSFLKSRKKTASSSVRKIQVRAGLLTRGLPGRRKDEIQSEYRNIVFISNNGACACLWMMQTCGRFSLMRERPRIFIVKKEITDEIWREHKDINQETIKKVWLAKQQMTNAEYVFKTKELVKICSDKITLSPPDFTEVWEIKDKE